MRQRGHPLRGCFTYEARQSQNFCVPAVVYSNINFLRTAEKMFERDGLMNIIEIENTLFSDVKTLIEQSRQRVAASFEIIPI